MGFASSACNHEMISRWGFIQVPAAFTSCLVHLQAVIAFLESRGDHSAFWRVLNDHGITKERLASYERKITMEPHMVQTDINELVNDFKAYLSVIQDVHDARDARVSVIFSLLKHLCPLWQHIQNSLPTTTQYSTTATVQHPEGVNQCSELYLVSGSAMGRSESI